MRRGWPDWLLWHPPTVLRLSDRSLTGLRLAAWCSTTRTGRDVMRERADHRGRGRCAKIGCRRPSTSPLGLTNVPTALCGQDNVSVPRSATRESEVVLPQSRGSSPWIASPCPPGVGEGGDEAVALAGDGGDEARVAVVVLELDAQAADVAVDDVALGHEVHAPDGVEDLLPGHDPPAAAREQVEQALLDAREVDHRVPGPHLAVA